MRLVVRYLLIEFSLAWAMVLAGFIRAGVQIWPFFANSLRAGLRRRGWRLCLGLLIGLPRENLRRVDDQPTAEKSSASSDSPL